MQSVFSWGFLAFYPVTPVQYLDRVPVIPMCECRVMAEAGAGAPNVSGEIIIQLDTLN
jgi:hypothetical protein